jgi:hypothetical protein
MKSASITAFLNQFDLSEGRTCHSAHIPLERNLLFGQYYLLLLALIVAARWCLTLGTEVCASSFFLSGAGTQETLIPHSLKFEPPRLSRCCIRMLTREA